MSEPESPWTRLYRTVDNSAIIADALYRASIGHRLERSLSLLIAAVAVELRAANEALQAHCTERLEAESAEYERRRAARKRSKGRAVKKAVQS